MSEVKESNVNAGEDTSGRLPTTHHEHDASLDDKDLLFICEGLPSDWRRLGVRLGLEWNKINVIADNNTRKDGVMETLVTWRDGQSTNQIPIMLNALREQGLVQLAERLCKRRGYKDDHDAAANQPQVLTQHRLVGASLDDQDLLFICEDLGSDWRRLGVRLGLEWNKINVIADKNTLKDGVMETLVTWRDGQSMNQMPIMLNALREQGLVQLAERLCKRRGYKDDLDAAANQPQLSTQHRLVGGYMQDADLLFISEMMGSGWKAIAKNLGINKMEIEDVDTKFQRQIMDAALEMLVRWRNRQGRNVNQLKILKAALMKKNKEIAKKLDAYYQHA
ncbi:uncharacterized protein LOC117112261 [Anneissia japonica]|uniref:uncharacterized protein LOC117112261 n=1 Tax=Anneissia japonica TaxID=1529436 RepID=UPI001425BADC|nr:uncharacterized protein LOC117112261 [Anneissia japonica]